MSDHFVHFVRNIYKTDEYIPLHEPSFGDQERKYIEDALESTYVSSVGVFVDKFERNIADFTKIKYAVATVNGTAALHCSLKLAGVCNDDLVITQSLSFVATSNAIHYCNATPVYIDVDRNLMSLSPDHLEEYLFNNCELRDDGYTWDKHLEKIVRACMPMHTLGFPADTNRIKEICDKYSIKLIEDAAESLGSYESNQHTGSQGLMSVLSFNGNKVMTTGGGGMLLTSDERIYKMAKHITTTAKVMKGWSWEHDQVGFNYRLPNINAALGLGQLENLNEKLKSKRKLAHEYKKWCDMNSLNFITERDGTKANYWLNSILFDNLKERDDFLKLTNDRGIGTRPLWKPIHELNLPNSIIFGDLSNTSWLFDRVVSIPSSPI